MQRRRFAALFVAIISVSCSVNGFGPDDDDDEKLRVQPSLLKFVEVTSAAPDDVKHSGGFYGVCLAVHLTDRRSAKHRCELGIGVPIVPRSGKRVTRVHAQHVAAEAVNDAIDEFLPTRDISTGTTCGGLRAFVRKRLQSRLAGATVGPCSYQGKPLPVVEFKPALFVGRPSKSP